MIVYGFQAVSTARSFIDTPFRHAGRQPGIALDCVGVPICVCRQLGTVAPDFEVEPYTMSANEKKFLELCDSYMQRKPVGSMAIGNVAAIRVRGVASHLGIVGDYHLGGFSLIHASNMLEPVRIRRVIEQRLALESRYFKVVAVYQLPGVD